MLVPFSMALITIIWEVRHHRELSFFVDTIPFFFLCVSFTPYAILCRHEYTLKKALGLAAKWIAVAFGRFWSVRPDAPAITLANVRSN